MVVTTEEIIVAAEAAPEFSWRAVFAGAVVGSAVIFFLLLLGAGVGLSLFTFPQAAAGTGAAGITLGAIYFFTAQAFGLTVGGYLAGRLMGPLLESESEEIFHSSTHGLTTWAVAVVMTATMVAISGLALAGPGMTAAAILGASNSAGESASPTDTNGYWVDMLFRPALRTQSGGAVIPATAPPQEQAVPVNLGTAGRTEAQARAEAGRILTVGLLHGDRVTQADHDQIVSLITQYTGADAAEAGRRVDDVQNKIHQEAVSAAEAARRFARFLSLWLAASLIFGALAASGAAVAGRWVDDQARKAV